jgi:amino acid transporter
VRRGGPPLWFGGSTVHPRLIARLVRYGSGFNSLGTPDDEGLARLSAALVIALITAVLYFGVRISVRSQLVLALISIIVVTIFLIVVIANPGPANSFKRGSTSAGYEGSYPALPSIRRRSSTICSSMSLPTGGSRISRSDPTWTVTLPSWWTSTVPIASSSEATACHSMLWLTGCWKICRSVFRWRLSR